MATEVWLYGSTARGDRDAGSDIDILVAGDADVDLSTLALDVPGELSVSQYSWEELQHMAGYGSLFLHHVRLEGKPLVESEERHMTKLLCALKPYGRASQELDCFSQVLDDVEEALERDYSVAFELSVIATAARHAAILWLLRDRGARLRAHFGISPLVAAARVFGRLCRRSGRALPVSPRRRCGPST
jgi:hypothetical protein